MVAVVAVAGYFCHTFGIFSEILDKDMTYISVVIGATFVIMSTWCGVKTFQLSQAIHKNKPDLIAKMEHQEEIGWFTAETFTTLGFIGTIIGMIYALKGFIGINPSDITSLQSLISDLVYGMSTALYTTLVGLVCSRLLMLQYFNLSQARREAASNETEI